MAQGTHYTPASASTPVVFQEDFTGATITATQAWSLFFTGGNKTSKLGEKRMTGWLWNYFLLGAAFASAVEIILFGGF
ncbi:hypothetical protein [[Limnothrix rosea] IAM M-220]|uniref:hypothetical protein n=1 Tax=[Limnothrix rosea] IAM M-220 TaxID=454133 RepID=UPI0009605359|nr:hypothetical protein [[Limnothrix rosea] IAM M-220]OKH17896.1 hypothetical protein NIES208_07825 [[Limnothrix rosea] IAM M-220]